MPSKYDPRNTMARISGSQSTKALKAGPPAKKPVPHIAPNYAAMPAQNTRPVSGPSGKKTKV